MVFIRNVVEFNKFCDKHDFSHVWFNCHTLVEFDFSKNCPKTERCVEAYVVSKSTTNECFKLFSFEHSWYIKKNKFSKFDYDQLDVLLNGLKENMKNDKFKFITINENELKKNKCNCGGFIERAFCRNLESIYIPQIFILENENCSCDLDKYKSIRHFIEFQKIKHIE